MIKVADLTRKGFMLGDISHCDESKNCYIGQKTQVYLKTKVMLLE